MEGLREPLLTFILVYGPAMIANGSPVAVLKGKKGHPIDFGRKWKDGRRLLGDGKTFEGFIIGVGASILAGILLSILLYIANTGVPARIIVITALVSGLGAMLGDIVKSFFKRRLGYERGASLPVFDQLDFYIGATVLVYLCPACVKPSPELSIAGAMLVLVLHRTTNMLAYKLGWKDKPW